MPEMSCKRNGKWPVAGCGVGLRTPHFREILRDRPKVDWFEAVTENFMDTGGNPIRVLEQVRGQYPVALHGVSMSLGSADPLDKTYLKRLKTLVERIDPFIVSDHLCWGSVDGRALYDLLPLPFTDEALKHVVARIGKVQDFLGREILIENVSSYISYPQSTWTEWDFFAETARRSGCGLLVDLNNVYVNAFNHKFDALEFLDGIPGEFVGQFHLAGHADMKTYLFDNHGDAVKGDVWELYREALKRWGAVSTLIEWDQNIPVLPRLVEECDRARAIYDEATAAAPAGAAL